MPSPRPEESYKPLTAAEVNRSGTGPERMAIRIQEARRSASTRSTVTRVTRGARLRPRPNITGLFAAYRADRNARCCIRGPCPPKLGVEGYFFKYERHFVYWRHLSNGDIGIVTILHERMHQN